MNNRPGGGGIRGGIRGAISGAAGGILPLVQRYWWILLIGGVGFLFVRGIIRMPQTNLDGILRGFPMDAIVGILVIVISLFEVSQRHERMLLDWWIAPVAFLFFSLAPSFPHDIQIIGLTAVGIGLFAAVFFNEVGQGGNFLTAIDLSATMNAAGLMILSYIGKWGIPYPAVVPGYLAVLVFFLSMARETFGRNPRFSVLALGAGVLAALSGNTIVLLIVFAGTVVAATVGGRMNRVPVRPGQQMSVALGPIAFAFVIPWDVVVAQLYLIAIIPKFDMLRTLLGL